MTQDALPIAMVRRPWPGYSLREKRTRLVQERLAARSPSSASVGAVNSFWMESSVLRENMRTSVIVHPVNGRFPPLQEGVIVQRSDPNGVREIPGDRPVRYTHGGISRNGPEDRGLSERCLVFNSNKQACNLIANV